MSASKAVSGILPTKHGSLAFTEIQADNKNEPLRTCKEKIAY